MKKFIISVLVLWITGTASAQQCDTANWNPNKIKIADSLCEKYNEQVRLAIETEYIGDTIPVSRPILRNCKMKNFYTIVIVELYEKGGILCDGVAVYKTEPYEKIREKSIEMLLFIIIGSMIVVLAIYWVRKTS